VSDTGTIYLSYDNVVKLQSITTVDEWNYSLTDTVINVGTNLSVSGYATAKSVSDDIVGNAQNAGAVTYSYSLSDSIANLTALGNAAIVSGATLGVTVVDTVENLLSDVNQDYLSTAGLNVKVLGGDALTLTVIDALNLGAITTDHSYAYGLVDSAQNLLTAKQTLISKAVDGVFVTGNDAGVLTVAQFVKLTGYTTVDTWTNAFADTLSHLEAAGTGVTDGHVYTLTDSSVLPLSLDVGGVTTLAGATNKVAYAYSVTDTATKIAATAVDLTGAAKVTATATTAADIIDGSDMNGALTVVYTTASQASWTTNSVDAESLSTVIAANADVISNFVTGDKIDLSAFAAVTDDSINVQEGGWIANNSYAITTGSWNSATHEFSQYGGVQSDSLIVWDADSTIGINQVAVVLTGHGAVVGDLILNVV
jgi:hypothetical protein